MNRSTVQPFRRSGALKKICEDLILWLKLEENFVDSSFYKQQTEELNSSVSLPGFSRSKYVSAPASAEFSGSHSIAAVGDVSLSPNSVLFEFGKEGHKG